MELSEQSGIGTSFNGVLPKVTRAMPIRGFLTGQAFEPEVVRQMSLALETICGKFGMKLADDPATRVVALKIIELAQRGVRDAPTLSEMTLKELKHYLPYAGA
jgi:hypothetical protein